MASEMIPFISVASVDFDKDLAIIKKMMGQVESMTHSENGYKLSERAEMAAGWWFYDVFFSSELMQKFFQLALPPGTKKDKRSVGLKIIDIFQKELKSNGSTARVRMYGDIPFGAGLWSFMMR